MSFETFIAGRHLRSRRPTGFISLITFLSIGGVFVGVMALLVILSVLNGFEDEVRQRFVGTNAHVIILRYDAEGLPDYEATVDSVLAVPGVLGAAPFVYQKAMIAAEGRSDGLIVKGVDLARERAVTTVADHIDPPLEEIDVGPSSGDSTGDGADAARDPWAHGVRVEGDSLVARPPLPEIVLGKELAEQLRVDLGQEVLLISPFASLGSPLGMSPKVRRFRVAGIFTSGLYDFDATLGYISIRAAQEFFGMGDRVTGIEVKVEDMYRAPAYETEILSKLGGFPYRSNNWIDLNSNLFAYMKIEKAMMFVVVGLIVFVAAFNIVSALVMVVMEKRREIGVLKSMGASDQGVLRIFLAEGLAIGGIGVVLGILGGFGLSYLIQRYEIVKLPGDVYFLDRLPVRMEPTDFLFVVAGTLLLCLLAALYPSWKAARLEPVDAIRSE